MRKKLKLFFILLICTVSVQNLTAQWQQTNGIFFENGTCFAANGNKVFAGTRAGVLLSVDSGVTWTEVNSGFPFYPYIMALAIHGNNIYAASSQSGVFLSTNDGASWTSISNGLPPGMMCTSLETNGSNVFVGGRSGIFLSTDSGTNWSTVNPGLTDTIIYSLATSGNNIFALSDNEIFMSGNNGTNWTTISTGLPPASIFSIAVADTNIYASVYGYGTFRTNDSGTTWLPVDTGITSPSGILFKGDSADFYLISSNQLFLSTNNCSSWAPTASPTYLWIYSLKKIGNKLLVAAYHQTPLATTVHGIFLSSNNGSDWSLVAGGLASRDLHTVAISGNNILVGTNDMGAFLSSDNGQSWLSIPSSPWGQVSCIAIHGSYIYMGTQIGVYLSVDDGKIFTPMNNGLPSITAITSIVFSGSNIFVGALYGGVFLSADSGASWTAVNTGLTDTIVHALTAKDSSLFAGTLNGGIFRSTNNGSTWTPVNTGLPSVGIAELEVNGTDLLAGTFYGGIYLSSNNGASWSPINNGLPSNSAVLSFAIDGTNIFACTADSGVFISANNGSNWTAIDNYGMLYPYVYSLRISGGNAYAATMGDGLYQRPLNLLLGMNQTNIMQNDFSVYPNPMKDQFTISMNKDFRKQNAEIEIFNVIGEMVFKERIFLSADITINTKNFDSGIYFVKLITSGNQYCRKIIIEQ